MTFYNAMIKVIILIYFIIVAPVNAAVAENFIATGTCNIHIDRGIPADFSKECKKICEASKGWYSPGSDTRCMRYEHYNIYGICYECICNCQRISGS